MLKVAFLYCNKGGRKKTSLFIHRIYCEKSIRFRNLFRSIMIYCPEGIQNTKIGPSVFAASTTHLLKIRECRLIHAQNGRLSLTLMITWTIKIQIYGKCTCWFSQGEHGFRGGMALRIREVYVKQHFRYRNTTYFSRSMKFSTILHCQVICKK